MRGCAGERLRRRVVAAPGEAVHARGDGAVSGARLRAGARLPVRVAGGRGSRPRRAGTPERPAALLRSDRAPSGLSVPAHRLSAVGILDKISGTTLPYGTARSRNPT